MDLCFRRFSFCEVKRRQGSQFAQEISQSRDFRSWHFACWDQNSNLFFTCHPTLCFSFGTNKGGKTNCWAKSITMCFNKNHLLYQNKLECPADIQEKLISVFPGIHESFKSLYKTINKNIKTLKVMENRHGPLKCAHIFISSTRKDVEVLFDINIYLNIEKTVCVSLSGFLQSLWHSIIEKVCTHSIRMPPLFIFVCELLWSLLCDILNMRLRLHSVSSLNLEGIRPGKCLKGPAGNPVNSKVTDRRIEYKMPFVLHLIQITPSPHRLHLYVSDSLKRNMRASSL